MAEYEHFQSVLEAANNIDQVEDIHAIINKLKVLEGLDYMNRLHWRDWDSFTCKLTSHQLFLLVKALAVVDEHIWLCSGSVSAVIWVFHELENKDYELSQLAADWVLAHNTNSYVPFGGSNYGARSLKEYYYRRKQYLERKNQKADEEQKRQEDAKKKRELMVQKSIERQQKQKHDTQKRRVLIEQFNELTLHDKLGVIAQDKQRALDFYPFESEYINYIDIDKLDNNIKINLMERLKDRKKGKWKMLYIKLTE